MIERSTIVALATAPAPAGIAVVRVSGPDTGRLVQCCFSGTKDPVQEPREMVFGAIGAVGAAPEAAILDHGMVVFFPNPHSFTGEDVAEFHLHGSLAIVEQLLRLLVAGGAVPAEPGAFTRRAFLNGKLDLVQAEAVAEMCAATSAGALRVAAEQLEGRLSTRLEKLGEPLRDALALVEAGIDFSDEGIELLPAAALSERLVAVQQSLQELVQSYEYGQLAREGCRILICGRPNVGKSSLLNYLLAKEQAIVSPIAGTTRDLIEAEAVLGGYRFILCDSAGITESADPIEQIGVLKARARFSWADLVLLVGDATGAEDNWASLTNELESAGASNVWLVVNKIDLCPALPAQQTPTVQRRFDISVKEKIGVTALEQALRDFVASGRGDTAAASSVVTNERHRTALLRASDRIATALVHTQRGSIIAELVAADIREALQALDEIVGHTYTEDILGRIFSRFCIGK